MVREALADFEAAAAFGLDRFDLDAIYIRASRPFAAEVDQRLDVRVAVLEMRLHGAVIAVSNPAGDAVGGCHAADGVAEEDALNAAVDDDPDAAQ